MHLEGMYINPKFAIVIQNDTGAREMGFEHENYIENKIFSMSAEGASAMFNWCFKINADRKTDIYAPAKDWFIRN